LLISDNTAEYNAYQEKKRQNYPRWRYRHKLSGIAPVAYAENFRGGGKVSSQSCDVTNQL